MSQWAGLGDGNKRVVNQSTGQPIQPEKLNCCMSPLPGLNISGTPGCPNRTSTDPTLHQACSDNFNCALPDPATGEYGPRCPAWNASAWLPSLQPLAKLIRANDPSGIPGGERMCPVQLLLLLTCALLSELHGRHSPSAEKARRTAPRLCCRSDAQNAEGRGYRRSGWHSRCSDRPYGASGFVNTILRSHSSLCPR